MVTAEQAGRWLDNCLSVLHLQVWEVSAVWVDAKTLPDDDDEDRENWGTISVDPESLTACVTVALGREPEDVARTILHECLHLALWQWSESLALARSYLPAVLYAAQEQARYLAEEQVVTMLERTLWAAEPIWSESL
jgi:hypothetical protein